LPLSFVVASSARARGPCQCAMLWPPLLAILSPSLVLCSLSQHTHTLLACISPRPPARPPLHSTHSLPLPLPLPRSRVTASCAALASAARRATGGGAAGGAFWLPAGSGGGSGLLRGGPAPASAPSSAAPAAPAAPAAAASCSFLLARRPSHRLLCALMR
jgi:hypothetical protein